MFARSSMPSFWMSCPFPPKGLAPIILNGLSHVFNRLNGSGGKFCCSGDVGNGDDDGSNDDKEGGGG